jgi:hypothetical protein
MDGQIGKKERVGNLFVEKFNALYNSVSYPQVDMHELRNDFNSDITHLCCRGVCGYEHNIKLKDVQAGIKQLKKRKHDSIPNLYSV